jgi:hypothetical protein
MDRLAVGRSAEREVELDCCHFIEFIEGLNWILLTRDCDLVGDSVLE